MRIGVVVSGGSKLVNMAEKTVEVLARRGYESVLINTLHDTDKKLIIFDYLIFMCETLSFFSGKLNPSLSLFLGNCGAISGKRCAVVLRKSTAFRGRAMTSLMRLVESEGVILKTSEYLSGPDDSSRFAESINVERNY